MSQVGHCMQTFSSAFFCSCSFSFPFPSLVVGTAGVLTTLNCESVEGVGVGEVVVVVVVVEVAGGVVGLVEEVSEGLAASAAKSLRAKRAEVPAHATQQRIRTCTRGCAVFLSYWLCSLLKF